MSKNTRRLVGIGSLLAFNVAALAWIYVRSGAGRPHHVRVLSAFPTTNVDNTDRLGLVFNVPVVEKPDIGGDLGYEPFRIEPAVPGKWTWESEDRLAYRLDRPLRPGRTYRLKPAGAFTERTGMTLIGETEFRFATRSLAVTSCGVESEDRTHVNLSLRFNQAVEPEALLKTLVVTDIANSTALSATCLSREAADELVIRMERPASGRVRVRVSASLTGSGGELPLASEFSDVLALNAPLRIEQVYPQVASFQKLPEVRFDFNRQLKTDQSKPNIRFEPAVSETHCQIYSDEVRVKAAFVCGQHYKAIVPPGLLDSNGKPLETEQVVSFTVPDRQRAMRFPQGRGILSPKGNLKLDLQVVNCGDIRITAGRVLENNLVAHLRGEDADATSRTILNKSIHVSAPQNKPATTSLDLVDLLNAPLGIYHIAARLPEESWNGAEAVVAVTDLGISCKRERYGVFVWVTSLLTAEPAEGVLVTAMSYNNQLLATEETDAKGCARLSLPEKPVDGPPYVVIAKRENDLNYCLLDERTWVPDQIDLAGRTPPDTYDVMLYPERGVYRPGDTVHMTGIVRTAAGATPPSFPMWIRTRRPDGRETAAETVEPRPENQGMFHVDIPTREDGQLGRYRFTATLPGSKDVLGETTALVEAFLPIRMELKADSDKPRYDAGEKPSISIDGKYLFGKPAVGVEAAVSGTYWEKRFESKQFADYRFGPLKTDGESRLNEVSDKLDGSGHLKLELAPPSAERAALWEVRAVATLTETGSRSVSKPVTFEYDGAARHLGLLLAPGEIVAADSDVEARWVQLDGHGDIAKPAALELSVDRIEHDWVYQESEGHMTWKTVERRIPVVDKRRLNVDWPTPEGSTKFNVEEPGEYRVTARETDGGAVAERSFRVFDPRYERDWAASPHPDGVDLTVIDGPFSPGSTAACLVQAPFAGQLLLTVEDDSVHESQLVEIKSSPMKIEFAVPETLRGDAFLTATLIRPIDPQRTKWLPTLARGIARLPVRPGQHAMPVNIVGPATLGPEECAIFAVHSAPPDDPAHPPVVHLWAVDDGILLTTAFESPDPLAYYFGPRKLTVETSDMFASLLPDIQRPKSMLQIGAGSDEDAEDMDLRRTPVPTRRRDPAVVWLASRTMDADGSAVFDVHMPDISGRMRVMAVAVDGDRYGHADQDVILSAPLLAEAGWPRFLAPGDHCRVPVKLFNNTRAPMEVSVTTSVNGGVTVEPREQTNVSVDATTPTLIWLDVVGGATGPATVEFRANGHTADGAVMAHSTGAFGVRPATAMDTESTLHRLKAGDQLTISPPDGFLAGTTFTSIEVSPRTDLELRPAVEQLLDYPYGCVEQTSSQLWALLEAGRLVKDRIAEDSRFGQIDDMIRAGVARLWSMQTRSGGLSYWPGSQTPDAWGTTYACGILAHASAAGFKIDAGFRKDAIVYLQKELNDSDFKDENTKAMMCEVLAAFGKPDRGWMARLSERADRLDGDGRAALARAWVQAGERDRARTVLPTDLSKLAVQRTTGGRITSSVSQLASLVRTLKLIDGESPRVLQLVDRLRKAAAKGAWANTMENAMAIAALIDPVDEREAPSAFTGELVTRDETVHFNQDKPLRFTDHDATSPIQIRTTGTGEMFVVSTSVGLRDEKSLKSYDHGLRVRRKWSRQDGSPVTGESFSVDDLVTVDVSLAAPQVGDGEPVDNVAIVDRLPAGFEIENPRLEGSASTDEPALPPDQVQFLDDRVLLFASAGAQTRKFRYHLRAVAAGSFVVPPVEASCMYDAMIASLQIGGRVEIAP